MKTKGFDCVVVTINGTTHLIDGKGTEKSLSTVSDFNDLLRKIINIPKVQDHYISILSSQQWAQLCTAMDIVRDSQRAIDKFQRLEELNYIDGDSLYIYGLLNAFYIQQDAIKTIYTIIFQTENFYFESYPNLDKVRNHRKDICHATERKVPKKISDENNCATGKKGKIQSEIFISPESVTRHTFSYLKYIAAEGHGHVAKIDVNIDDCIEIQAKDIKDILRIICKELLSLISKEDQLVHLREWIQALRTL